MAPYEDREQMIEDQILAEFLDNAVKKAKKSIENKGVLTTEDAIPLMLKSQFNHISHLEEQMVTKNEFNDLKDQFAGLKNQFAGLKDQFNFTKWLIAFGFAFLASLQIYLAFLK